MATWDTTASADTGDAEVGMLGNYTNLLILRRHWLGDKTAVSQNGEVVADGTTYGASRILWKFGQDSGTGFFIGYTSGEHILEAPLNCDGNEITGLLLEALATGSLSTTEARLQWDTDKNVPAYGDGTNTFYVGRTRTDASTYMRIPCALNVASLGTPATASTATIFGGWTLDAAAEELNIVALKPIPNGWTGAHDCLLEVHVLLLAAETANDDIDMDGVWWSLVNGENVSTKSSTGFAAITQDIGSDNAQYDLHLCTLTVDHDDATNTVHTDDLFVATINHNVAGQVAGVVVVNACLAVPVWNYDD